MAETKAELLFRFRERAAIKQYDANMTPHLAAFGAANELRRELAARIPPEKLPVEILREVNRAGRQGNLLD